MPDRPRVLQLGQATVPPLASPSHRETGRGEAGARAGAGLRVVALCALVGGAAMAACGSDPSAPVLAGADGGSGAPTSGGAAGGAGTTSAGTAGIGGDTGGGSDAEPVLENPPKLLSETGLYADLKTRKLATGVRTFRPRYPLWTDGATKQRWVLLPEGSKIDSSQMGFWNYPVGTKLWKEFTRDGVTVETRLTYKFAERGWYAVAFLWREDGSDADAVPEGVPNARGTEHDVPSRLDCRFCHNNMADFALGFSAIQLAHPAEGEELTLAELTKSGRLSKAPPSSLEPPGSPAAKAALGYLHSNCGACHNEHGKAPVPLRLWLKPEQLTAPEATDTYQTTVRVLAARGSEAGQELVTPGAPEKSFLLERASTRDVGGQMPPLGTELTDPDGLQLLDAWIRSLDATP